MAQGLGTAGDYANRLSQSKRVVDEVIERESRPAELIARMNEIKRLAPASEEIEFNGSIIHVDNAWLHEAVDNIIRNAAGDIEQRRSMLSEVSDRLDRLQKSIKEGQTTRDRALQDQRAKLDNILARSEYKVEEKRESVIKRWLQWIRGVILRLLEMLFGRPARTSGAGLSMIFRILVFLGVIVALMFGAVKLAGYLRLRKRPKKEETETREVLGEEIAEDATAADLFANASELARQGEYRKAIRRAYIALLCDLEQRGKLRLSRSKTNRDYLDAIRPEQVIYPTFSVMTNTYEHIWYGQERATEEEFQDFVTLYEETVS